MKETLLSLGFSRVITLDTAACDLDLPEKTLLLCLWGYTPATLPPASLAAVHPYYPASQQAYRAARKACEIAGEAGMHVRQDTELRLKPLLAHLHGFTQGRNTLSSVEGLGSRFHIQTLLMMEEAAAYDDLWEENSHGLACGACRRCMEACPTGAIDETGYHREKCLRNAMMSGKPVPEAMRPLMANRLLGCDACQACCPRNVIQGELWCQGASLPELLSQPKAAAKQLADTIGSNMALPNRVLAQACLVAGNSGDAALLPLLGQLREHPSPVVREHAVWAYQQLEKMG